MVSDGQALLAGEAEDAALRRALPRWRERLSEVPSSGRLAAWQEGGMRLVIPGDAEWPSQLDDLGDTRPVVLWVRGQADLRFACLSSVSMVGSRARHPDTAITSPSRWPRRWQRMVSPSCPAAPTLRNPTGAHRGCSYRGDDLSC